MNEDDLLMKSGFRDVDRGSRHGSGEVWKKSLEVFKAELKDDRADENFDEFREIPRENVVEYSGRTRWS